MPSWPGVLLVVLVGAVAEISSVHIDIARLAREVYRIPDDLELAKWTRSLVECLVLRDRSLNPYGDFLLGEVEEFRKKEADRKKKISALSKDSVDSKDSALSDLIHSNNHSFSNSNTSPENPIPPERRRKMRKDKEAPPAARERDPIWDLVENLFFPDGIMPSQRSRVGKIVRDLKSISATPEQIRTKTDAMRRTDWGRAAGPEGLIKQWANLGMPKKSVIPQRPAFDDTEYDLEAERNS